MTTLNTELDEIQERLPPSYVVRHSSSLGPATDLTQLGFSIRLRWNATTTDSAKLFKSAIVRLEPLEASRPVLRTGLHFH